jgi:small subunit ribosomal protein S18
MFPDAKGLDSNVNQIKKKPCKFCVDSNLEISYKNPRQLKYFITDRGKIIPRRISGNCATHQRMLTTAIKRARQIALLSYTIKDF